MKSRTQIQNRIQHWKHRLVTIDMKEESYDTNTQYQNTTAYAESQIDALTWVLNTNNNQQQI